MFPEKFPGNCCTYLINLRKMKGRVKLKLSLEPKIWSFFSQKSVETSVRKIHTISSTKTIFAKNLYLLGKLTYVIRLLHWLKSYCAIVFGTIIKINLSVLRDSRWLSCQNWITQRLTSGEGGFPLNNSPKLAIGHSNNRDKNSEKYKIWWKHRYVVKVKCGGMK